MTTSNDVPKSSNFKMTTHSNVDSSLENNWRSRSRWLGEGAGGGGDLVVSLTSTSVHHPFFGPPGFIKFKKQKQKMLHTSKQMHCLVFNSHPDPLFPETLNSVHVREPTVSLTHTNNQLESILERNIPVVLCLPY